MFVPDIDSLKDVGSEAENQEQNSVFVFSGATKKLIQKAYKTDDSLPFTVKDIDQNLTNVSLLVNLLKTKQETF